MKLRQSLICGVELSPLLLFLLMFHGAFGIACADANSAATQPSDGAVRSTIAVLWDPSDELAHMPQPNLIELQLTRGGNLALVDRSAIDAVLKEQQLAAAFEAAGGADRIKLGRLLKADYLVILRTRGDAAAKGMEMTVCETHGGLRLAHEVIASTKTPENDAAAAVALIQSSLDRAAGGITTIFAIPPFQSLDLERTYDSMQDAYASILEQSLLSRRGVLVVELAEAQAISRELAVSNDPAVHRVAPVYIVGEFRHGSAAQSHRVTITLKSNRGTSDVVPPISKTMESEEVPAFLLTGCNSVLAAAVGAPTTRSAPPGADAEQSPAQAKQEAELLHERGNGFALVGDWERALALFEASLLVQPNQPSVHADAVRVLSHLPIGIEVYRWGAEKTRWDQANAAPIVGFMARRTIHLEAFLRSSALVWDNFQPVVPFFAITDSSEYESRRTAPDLAEKILELRRQKRDVFFSVFEAKQRAHAADAYSAERHLELFFYPAETPEEVFQVRLRAIKLFQDAPLADNIAYNIFRFQENIGLPGLPRPQLDKLLTAGEALDSPSVSKAVAKIRAEGPDFKMHFSTFRYVPTPAAQDTALYRQLNLTFTDSNGLGLADHAQIIDWKSAGKGADVAISRDALFVMTQKDVLQQIYKSDKNAFDFSQICFDGKYVWAPVVQAEPLILIVDPAAGRVVAKLTAADGVPAMSVRAVAAAISPGHALLSGGFGRGWIAWASYDRAGGPTFKVFWEARNETGRAATDPHFAFDPFYAVTLEGKSPDANGATVQRIILARAGKAGMSLPLIIDPVSSSVAVLRSGGPQFGLGEFALGDSLYWIANAEGFSGRLHKWGLPDFEQHTLPPSIPGFGPLVFFDGKLNVAGDRGQWIISRNPAGPYVTLGGDMPGRYGFRRICISNFYGVLLMSREMVDIGVWKAEIPDDVLMKHSADPEEAARRMTVSDVAAALKAADDHYAQEAGRARALLIVRMKHAQELADRPDRAEAIGNACQALASLEPRPEIGVHHAEASPAAPGTDLLELGLSDACEDVVCFSADLELAHKRWLDAVALMIRSPGTMMADDLARANAAGDPALTSKIKSMSDRLEEAKRGIPTAWYREVIKDDGSGKPPVRAAPVAQVIHDVHLNSPRVGGGLNFPFEVRTLIAPFRSGESMASGTIEQIFQGDEMVYARMHLPAGNRGQVGDERFIGAATYENMLSAGKGRLWAFPEPGQYTLKLIVINGDGWNDVLDAYEETFTVGPAL
jgi:hypothetical protein